MYKWNESEYIQGVYNITLYKSKCITATENFNTTMIQNLVYSFWCFQNEELSQYKTKFQAKV